MLRNFELKQICEGGFPASLMEARIRSFPRETTGIQRLSSASVKQNPTALYVRPVIEENRLILSSEKSTRFASL